MKALIDGDIVAYRCAASCEPTLQKLEREPLDVAVRRTDELIYRILNDTGSSECGIYLTGSENFRTILYPDYKANRKKIQRPVWLDSIRHFLVEEWNAKIVTHGEGDDGLGIHASESAIICTNDKDLFQIQGKIYDFTKQVFHDISEIDSAIHFWSAMLIGDTSDNLPGIPGIGRVKGKRLIQSCSPGEMEDFVFGMYRDHGLDFRLFYRLFRIVRSEKELEEAWDEATEREKQRQTITEARGGGDTGNVPRTDS